jgi:hypothetical protein
MERRRKDRTGAAGRDGPGTDRSVLAGLTPPPNR